MTLPDRLDKIVDMVQEAYYGEMIPDPDLVRAVRLAAGPLVAERDSLAGTLLKIADKAKYLSEPAWNLEGCALVGAQIWRWAAEALQEKEETMDRAPMVPCDDAAVERVCDRCGQPGPLEYLPEYGASFCEPCAIDPQALVVDVLDHGSTPPRRILVCGSRGWTDADAIRFRLELWRRDGIEQTVIHGGARGADRIAGREATKLGYIVKVFLADWRPNGVYNPRAGLERNIRMLDSEPDLIVAFQLNGSTGTQHTIDNAGQRGIAVEVNCG